MCLGSVLILPVRSPESYGCLREEAFLRREFILIVFRIKRKKANENVLYDDEMDVRKPLGSGHTRVYFLPRV